MYKLAGRAAIAVLVVSGFLAAPAVPAASTETASSDRYHVDPARGDDIGGTGSARQPFRTINRALTDAQSGETVRLRPGASREDMRTVRPGVTVTGPRSAVVSGAGGSSRIFQVHHNDTTLRGFTIEDRICDHLVEVCYRDRGIYVVSTVANDGVAGTKIDGMRLTNLGGEYIRIKYLATDSVVERNQIAPRSIYDFAVPNTGTGQNGEGIYLGTAPEQLTQNPSPEPDATNEKGWSGHSDLATMAR